MIKNKRFVVTLGALLICTATMSSGCTCTANKTTGFRVISREKTINGEVIQEVIDEDTGVHYYVNMSYQQGSMCPVYNSDGTIKVDKEE